LRVAACTFLNCLIWIPTIDFNEFRSARGLSNCQVTNVMTNNAWFPRKSYHTRLDRFRVREGIDLAAWASEAGMSVTQLQTYRSGRIAPRACTIADLVRSASVILSRAVDPSSLFDIGDDEPLATTRVPMANGRAEWRTQYDSPLDAVMRKYDISPLRFASEAAISRQELLKVRANRATLNIQTLATIVRTFRRLGYDVRSTDLLNLPDPVAPAGGEAPA
jgi:transcriptional regulator with XRE-family HTH domain